MAIKINVENLNLFYGNFQALKNVDLKIEEKEITAFIGPLGLRQDHPFKDLKPHERPDRGLQDRGQGVP